MEHTNMIKIESMEKEFEELVEERRKSIQQEVDKKIARLRIKYVVIEIILSIMGFGIIGYTSGYLLALGIFLVFWGNNMSTIRSVFKKHNINREIWKDT